MKDLSFCLVAAIVIAGVVLAFMPERHGFPRGRLFVRDVVVVHARPI